MTTGQRGRGARREVSAGGVVIRYLEGIPHVLLIRDPYRNWGLPKGHLEGREAPADAAIREVREETGIEASVGPQLGTIDWHFRLRGRLIHKYCHFFLMYADEGELVPERSEGISECRWIPLDQALLNVSYENARQMIRSALRELGLESDPAAGTG